MSSLETRKIEPLSGTTVTLGASGDAVTIPAGATLHLESDELHYDFTTYNLYVKLGAAGSTVDVTIRS